MENKVSILYIGNAPEIIQYLSSSEEIDLVVQPNALDADLYLVDHDHPNAILCDFDVPGSKNGFTYHDEFRKNETFKQIALMLVSRQFDKDQKKMAFDKKIDDCYHLPLPPVENLLNRIRWLNAYHQKYPFEPPQYIAEQNYKMPWPKRVFDIAMASIALILLSPLLLLVIIAIRIESKGKIYYISKRFGRSKPFDFYKLRSMKTGSDKQLDKLAEEKNQYSANLDQLGKVDFSKGCPRCTKVKQGKTCSPVVKFNGKEMCKYQYYMSFWEEAKLKSIIPPNPTKPQNWIRCPKCDELQLPKNKFCSGQKSVYDGGEICLDWLEFQKYEIRRTTPIYKKISKDPRVTKVGKFIRNTSIDELPQLINVIKGDMSIVGNRPLPLYEANELTTDTMSKRFLAPAGITGLWQVELRGKGGVMSEEQRNEYDNEYADHFDRGKYSFRYDLDLIRRTFKALLQKDSV